MSLPQASKELGHSLRMFSAIPLKQYVLKLNIYEKTELKEEVTSYLCRFAKMCTETMTQQEVSGGRHG